MEHRFNLALTREHYAESFDQFIRYGSIWRKIEYFLVIFFFAVAAWCASVGEWFAAVLITFIGVYEFFAPTLKKKTWLKHQMESESAGSEVEILLDDEGLESPSKEKFPWKDMWRVVNAPKGILLWPEKKKMVYLPKEKMGEETVNYVLSMCGKR